MSKQIGLSLARELIVDNFAGGGGASCGIESGLGRPVDIAINHDESAVAMHRANHPQTKHYCESVFDVDPLEVTVGRPVGLAWFSPDCKHFSKAKGSKPRSKNIRGLAWVVIHWVNKVRPRVIMLENVEEFKSWAPLDSNGEPRESRKGWFFKCFVGALRRRGYRVEYRELRACDYGAGTLRKRFFMVARCDGAPIVFPEATHFEKPKPGQKRWRAVSEFIDSSLACPSIFLSPVEVRAQKLKIKRPLAEATQRRIAKGMLKFVLGERKPFIVQYHSAENGFALCAPYITECANASSQRNFDVNEPLRTQCAEVKGGHYALVAPFLLKFYGGVVGTGVERPLGTVTTIDHHGLVAASLCKLGVGSRELLHKSEAQGARHCMVAAFLAKYYGSGNDYQSLEEPLHTVRTKDCFQLVTVVIDGCTYAVVDIGLRMLQPHELYGASGFPNSYIRDWGYFEEAGVLRRKALTKTVQVRMVGNAVPPPFSEALVRANVPELARDFKAVEVA